MKESIARGRQSSEPDPDPDPGHVRRPGRGEPGVRRVRVNRRAEEPKQLGFIGREPSLWAGEFRVDLGVTSHTL